MRNPTRRPPFENGLFLAMFRPLELFIGLRYTRAKRRNHFISFISLISMLGLAVGVMALIVVISVMNGFEKELTQRILGMVAHATIAGVNEPVRDWQHAIDIAQKNPHVRGAAPYIEGQALLRGDRNAPAIVHGIDETLEPTVSDIDRKMIRGKLSDLHPGGFGIVLGNELAMKLGVDVGDKVTVFTDDVNVKTVGAIPRRRRFDGVGVF